MREQLTPDPGSPNKPNLSVGCYYGCSILVLVRNFRKFTCSHWDLQLNLPVIILPTLQCAASEGSQVMVRFGVTIPAWSEMDSQPGLDQANRALPRNLFRD